MASTVGQVFQPSQRVWLGFGAWGIGPSLLLQAPILELLGFLAEGFGSRIQGFGCKA